MEKVGSEFGMKKIMLTVATRNTRAMEFYASMGLAPDEISPSQVLGTEARSHGYEILSKKLP